MTTLVFFLEEPSAQAMLESFLPSILPRHYQTQYLVFEGKSDLEKRLVRRLQGWRKPDCRFIVIRDQDSAACAEVKSALLKKCSEGNHPECLVRIACHELESWYLGDLWAVERAFGLNNLAHLQRKKKYRDPDAIPNAARELKKITHKKYQKIAGSREIGKYLDVKRNQSHSFTVFVNGLNRLIEAGE